MAQSIILELQSLATSRQNDITDLLRKALLVASKLHLDDFKNWINSELHGYRQNDIPEYRKISSELKVKNPYHGLQPFVLGNQKLADLICNIEIRDAIESLENLLRQNSRDNNFLSVPLSHSQQASLMELQGDFVQLPVVRIIGRNQVAAIIDAVRTRILEWALQLEEEGIIGNGLTFSESEKYKALESASINIHNFQGVLGDISNSTMDLNLTQTITKNDFDSLANTLKSNSVEDSDIEKLYSALLEDPEPTQSGKFGTKVSAWIGTMISKASSGSWDIGIGAASSLLATAISKYYGL